MQNVSLIDRLSDSVFKLFASRDIGNTQQLLNVAQVGSGGRITQADLSTQLQHAIAARGHSWDQLYNRFRVETTRAAIMASARALAEGDPRVSEPNRKLARDLSSGGFQLVITESPSQALENRVADIAQQVFALLDAKLEGWLEDNINEGDLFLHFDTDSSGAFRQVYKPVDTDPLNFYRNSNSADRFTRPEQAFVYSPEGFPLNILDFESLASRPSYGRKSGLKSNHMPLAAWHVIHSRWRHRDGQRYGCPQYFAGRQHYKWLDEGELNAHFRRWLASSRILVHTVPDADATELNAYLDAMQIDPDNPFAPHADMATSTPNGIYSIQGDNTHASVEDLNRLQQILELCSPVPLPLLSFAADLNRDTITALKDEYHNSLSMMIPWVWSNIYEPVLNRVLITHNIDPTMFTMTMAPRLKPPVKLDELKAVGEAILALRTSELLTDERIIRSIASALPDADIDTLLSELEELRAEQEREQLEQRETLMLAMAMDSDEGDDEEEVSDE